MSKFRLELKYGFDSAVPAGLTHIGSGSALIKRSPDYFPAELEANIRNRLERMLQVAARRFPDLGERLLTQVVYVYPAYRSRVHGGKKEAVEFWIYLYLDRSEVVSRRTPLIQDEMRAA